jgi:hypothetical protein
MLAIFSNAHLPEENTSPAIETYPTGKHQKQRCKQQQHDQSKNDIEEPLHAD